MDWPGVQSDLKSSSTWRHRWKLRYSRRIKFNAVGSLVPYLKLENGSYFGGKNGGGVVHSIAREVPRHEVKVCGFLGRCALMRYLRPAALNVGFDLAAGIIADFCEASARYDADGAKKFHFHNADFLKADLSVFDHPKAFFYLDPPYLHSTRLSSKRYDFELSDDQHCQLLDIASHLSAMVAISCYDSPLYSKRLKGWRKTQFLSMTRSGEMALETIYMNYPKPDAFNIHDATFYGENFREREKGKRRVDTLYSKMNRLTPSEKAFFLQSFPFWLDSLE